jgi:hypothetical protein
MNGSLIQGFAGLFNQSDTISKQFKSGLMVDSLGVAYAMDQNVDTHTNGAATASNVNGANQTGASGHGQRDWRRHAHERDGHYLRRLQLGQPAEPHGHRLADELRGDCGRCFKAGLRFRSARRS